MLHFHTHCFGCATANDTVKLSPPKLTFFPSPFFFFQQLCLLHYIGDVHFPKTPPEVAVSVRPLNCNLQVSEMHIGAQWQESDVDRERVLNTCGCAQLVLCVSCFLFSWSQPRGSILSEVLEDIWVWVHLMTCGIAHPPACRGLVWVCLPIH